MAELQKRSNCTPFWLWPNLLSLDAPLVGVVWQNFLSQTLLPVQPAATAVLAISIWLVYAADRLIDTLSPALQTESPRHRFARSHRRAFVIAAVPLSVLDLYLALCYLPPEYFVAAMLFLTAVVARFFAVLRLGARPWPKAMWTAIIFAAGVWTPILFSNPFRPGAALFALLCWWNCLAIDTWEGPPAGRSLTVSAGVLGVVAALFFFWTGRPVALAEALVASGFCILAAGAQKFSRDFLRVAVDVCMLSPLLVHAR